MSFTHTLVTSYQSGGVVLATANFSYTNQLEIKLDDTIADSVTDQDAVVAIDVSEVQLFYMMSTQDLTVETNDSGSPDDTIALKANKPYIWWADHYDSFLLTVDVTVLYLTNASGSSAEFALRCLVDASP